MLSEMECREALDDIYVLAIPCQEEVFEHRSQYLKERYILIKQLIKEHFDPQPYTFRELNKGMWIWDDKENRADKIFETFEADFGVPYIKFDGAFEEMRTIVEFEVNRFFPLTKAKGE